MSLYTARQPQQDLVVTVSCPLKTNPPTRVEVVAAGTRLAAIDVPVLDRAQIELRPTTIALSRMTTESSETELEIRQYPGSLDAPVQWHAIEFRESR